MLKLNLLVFTILLICFIHNSNAETQATVINTVAIDKSATLALNQPSPAKLSAGINEDPVTHSGNWFSLKPFSESISLLLMVVGLGLVYLADYRKKKNK